ncbi:hypothetical protein [Streptomyces sp. NK08204]|uniref:hypothetical protein n=1 Tax=Streptomyces sp. NK08204 TaxID=2873260 RepID=UPI001CED3A08|nr:hypothetical protein [Streptomyces sp. NK08204]
MLSLAPPFLSVNGFSLFPDHADPLQWYYLPMGPSIAVRDEGGAALPAFSLLEFRGDKDETTGGLLNFDVVLGPPADRLDSALDEVAGQIQSQLNLPDRPRRPVPVPLESGSVKLVLLDSESGAAPGDSRFVERIIHQAQPSLYGSNQAAFSAVLDARGATLLAGCLDGAVAPIGVVYALDFLALRPAYTVTLNIRWDELKERLDKTFGVSGVFLSSQITEQLDRLKDERVIDVQDDLFVPEGEAGKSVIASHDRAVSAVYDMITDSFFEAALAPRPAPDGWDRAAALATEFGRVAMTGGLSLAGTYTYRRSSSVEEVQKRLNVRMGERTAVRRTVYPQGHLSGIAALIAASGRPQSDFTRRVSVDDPWFSRRSVKVVSRVDFGSGFLTSVAVDLRYGDDTKTVLLDPQNNGGEADWPSQVAGGRMVEPVTVDITYHLAKPVGWVLPDQLTVHDTTETEIAEIRPGETFAFRPVLVRDEGVPWENWRAVTVELRYQDAASGVSGQYVLDLVHDQPLWQWPRFIVGSAPGTYAYRLTYHGIGRPDVVREWTQTDDGEVRVGDPFPDTYPLTVRPLVSWTSVSALLVDLLYEDPAHQLRQEASMEFTSEKAGAQLFSVGLRDPALRRVTYRVTVLYTDGHMGTVPESSTGRPTLTVAPGMPAHQAVVVRVDTQAAEQAGVQEVRVEFAEPGTETATASYSFTRDSAPVVHEFDVTGPPGYRYRVARVDTSGLSRLGAWTDADLPVLDVPGA